MGDNFYSGIDEPGNDWSDLAITVLDQLGIVKRKWTTDPTHKGVGAWNGILNYNDFLVVVAGRRGGTSSQGNWKSHDWSRSSADC